MAEAIDRLAFDFCDATNATSVKRIDEALAALRAELAAGTEEGEALAQLTKRVLGIFFDSQRAARIAQTEASRAMHAGQLMMAEQANEQEPGLISGFEWLASSDACDECMELDGMQVAVGGAFAVNEDARAAYRIIEHPPLHPACMCSLVETIA